MDLNPTKVVLLVRIRRLEESLLQLTNLILWNQVWRNYYGSGVPNYGEKSPMSYYKNTGDLTKPLGYVIPKHSQLRLMQINGMATIIYLMKEKHLPAVMQME